jgi:hypothetical protein
LQAVLSAYFANQQLTALAGAYAERSMIPGALLWVNAWRPVPHLLSWIAVLAWSGCASLAVAFDLLAWRARRRLLAALPRARAVVRFEFGSPHAVGMPSLLAHALVPLGALLWAHALRPGLLSPALLQVGLRAWLVAVVWWLGLEWIPHLTRADSSRDELERDDRR